MSAVCEDERVSHRVWVWHIWVALRLACASCAYSWVAAEGEVCPKCGEQTATVLGMLV